MSDTDASKAPAALAGDAGHEEQTTPESSGNAGGATSPFEHAAFVDFYHHREQEGPIVVAHLAAGGGAMNARTFATAEDAAAFAEKHCASGRHVYIVNNAPAAEWTPPEHDTRRDGGNPPTEADIAHRHRLQLDLDPVDGADADAAKAAMHRAIDEVLGELRTVAEALPEHDRPPGRIGVTEVVDSGRGVHLHMELASPVVSGEPATGVNEAIIGRFRAHPEHGRLWKADGVANANRVMRAVGSRNPRTGTIARLLHRDENVRASLALWRAVLGVGGGNAPSAQSAELAHTAEVGENVARLSGMDDPRLDNVSDHTKAVIVQGKDAENPDRHPSRSEWLFFACCEMVRAGCDDETIYAVITDPDLGISASVLENPNPRRYALRQIERAHDKVIQPELLEMNDRYAVIQNWGGKCRVAEEVYEEGLARHRLTRLSFEDIRNAHSNRFVVEDGGGDKVNYTPLGKWWLQHPRRREYRTLAFNPKGTPPTVYNLWRGFVIAPTPGDWALLRQHIVDVLAAGEKQYAEWIMRWAAWLVQNPDQPAEVALVFRGGQGTGKGTFARALCDLLGQHAMHVSRASHVSGKFNSHLRDCVLLYADEVTATTDRDSIGEIKRLVTEPTLVIEPKGVDSEVAPNRLHVVMTSNEDWVVPMDDDDRRFVVFDMDPCRKEDRAWFSAIHRQLAQGGLAAFLHDLLAMDLGDWHPRHDRPVTSAMNEQKAASLRGAEAAWFELLTRGELPSGEAADDGGFHVTSSALLEWMRHFRPRDDIKHNHLSTLLGQPQSNHRQHRDGMGFDKTRRGRGTPTQWVVPPLPEARKRWDERRFAATWSDDAEWAVQSTPF